MLAIWNARVKGKMVRLECNQKGSGVQSREKPPPKRGLDGPPSRWHLSLALFPNVMRVVVLATASTSFVLHDGLP